MLYTDGEKLELEIRLKEEKMAKENPKIVREIKEEFSRLARVWPDHRVSITADGFGTYSVVYVKYKVKLQIGGGIYIYDAYKNAPIQSFDSDGFSEYLVEKIAQEMVCAIMKKDFLNGDK